MAIFGDNGTLAQAVAAGRAAKEAKLRAQANQFRVPEFGNQYRDYTNLASATWKREAPQAAESPFRNQQASLLRQLQADAAGRGPSQDLVRMQAQGMADRGAQQQLAMAAGARPGQAASAGRNAAFNAANIQSQVGGQAAQAGLQARLGAMGMLGQAVQGARGQDNQMSQFNTDMQLRQLGLNDQSQLEALRQRLGLSGMAQQGTMSLEQMRNANQMAQMSQPKWWERGLGAIGQGAQTFATLRSPGGGQQQSGGGQMPPGTDWQAALGWG